MNMDLTEVQLKYKTEFRKFVDEQIVPFAHEHDVQEKINPKVIKQLSEKGYLGAMIPKEYGGLGMDNITLGILNEEIGRGCSSVRSLLTVHGMAALGILRWGTQEQRDYWLPKMANGDIIGAFALSEPNVGSDAKSIETTAELIKDKYMLNGKKKWITMTQIADMFIVFAKSQGKPTAFIVEKNTPGFSIIPMNGFLGARASMIGEIHINQCMIPKSNIVGNVGTGITHVALTCLDYGRYTIACGCVGIGQACLEHSIKYARERKQFGEPLSKNQLIRKMISEMSVNIKAARLLYYRAGYLKDVIDPDSIMETWTAKYFAAIMVNKVSSDAVQIYGGNGCYNDYPIERYYRDARINEIIEGTTQMHEILISSSALRSI